MSLRKKMLRGAFALLLAVSLLLTGRTLFPISVRAANAELQFDSTNVLDDLRTATIDGKPFDISLYPYDATGLISRPRIVNFVEYCYPYDKTNGANYGLYLYFYNPSGKPLAADGHTVQLAVATTTQQDGNVIPSDYEKFRLKMCNASTGNYENLFCKFRIMDHESADGKTVFERVNPAARRYDISGVELVTDGNTNATDYTVGGTYTFRGYAKGYGLYDYAESNLTCEVRDLETVRLDLSGETDGVDKRTYWRSNSSSLGKGHQNQINSVFFAIDKNVLEMYGYILQRIKAEWWEYKTRPVVVIENEPIFNSLKNYSGVKISDYDRNRGYSMCYYDTIMQGFTRYGWSWNEELRPTGVNVTVSKDVEALLPLLFYTGGIDVDDYTLLADNLQRYLETYNKSYERGKIQFGSHAYSADLFETAVDSGRTQGYNLREFDIGNPDDYWDIRSYDSTHNWWNKLWDFGFGGMTTNDEYADVPPIQMIKPEDVAAGDISNHLKINAADVDRFKDYYNSVKNNSEVFLFRYAHTDYFATDLNIYDIANNVHYSATDYAPTDKHIAELRQGTQFFAFDILEFTFNKDGVYTVIPVVSSPIDHISSLTPSIDPTPNNWLKLVLMLAALILLVVIAAPILPYVFKAVFWLISLPFRVIGAIVNAIKKKN